MITAGLVPSDPGRAVSFLVRTRQWERYDAVDPDGEILRAYAERLGAWNYERNELRAAAEEAGRPLPCEASTSPSSVSGYGSGTSGHGITPGGTGTMTGGFTGGFGGI